MSFAVIADEHVPRVVVKELRANGFEVAWIDEGYELGKEDHDHVEESARTGAAIVTNDTDFLSIADQYDHAGVIMVTDQRMDVATFVRGMKRIARFVPAGSRSGVIIWLDEWVE